MSAYLTTVYAPYPSGAVEACYALVSSDGPGSCTGAACTIKRAMELQAEGVAYHAPSSRLEPQHFDTWFGPDFPPIGGARV